jgi:protein-S-isoprenylcysteine O-methyltransferase Ste14
MYMGYWLVLAGLAVMYRTVTPIVLLIVMIASLSRRAGREDEVLDAAFGKAWQDYGKCVPAFVPRLW